VSTVVMIDCTVAVDFSDPSDIILEQTSFPSVPITPPDGEPMGIGGAAVTHTGCMNPGIVRWTRARKFGTLRTAGAWWDWKATLPEPG